MSIIPAMTLSWSARTSRTGSTTRWPASPGTGTGLSPHPAPEPSRRSTTPRGGQNSTTPWPPSWAPRRRRAQKSGPGTGLVRVVEREPHDGGRDALAVPVQLADLDRGADLGVLHGHPAQRDVCAQDR